MATTMNRQHRIPKSPKLSTSRRLLIYVLCEALIIQPTHALADPVAANSATTVYRAPNGVPVVDIATANSAGLSHNRYTSYDVDSRGLVLNNGNSSQVMRQSQLAGQVPANLKLNSEAKVILNEVVAPSRSNLAGYTEVLGGTADVVVANPYGITCNGCGFINTPNVMLTTGLPQISAAGALTGFQVNSGDILITGAGLDGTKQDYLSLVARAIRADGQINAKDLAIAAGNNNWDYATRSVTGQVAGAGAAPAYAFDSTVFGGMYANRIRIQATEAGVGVRMLGEAAATGDDFTINAAGKLIVQSRLSAERDIQLASSASDTDAVSLDGSNVSAKRNVAVTATAGGATLNGGALIANNNIDLNLGALTDTASSAGTSDNNKRYAGAAMNLNTTGAANLDGVSYGSGGAFNASVGSLTVGVNDTALYAGTTLDIVAANNLSLASAAVKSTGDMNLTSTSGEITTAAGVSQGIQSTAGNIVVSANGMTNAGVITADGGSLTMRVDNTLINTGTGHAANGISISDRANGGSQKIENSGSLLSDATLNIAANAINNAGRVQAAAGGTTTAHSLTNSGIWIASNTAGKSASFTLGDFTNTGTLQSAEDLSLTLTNSLDNGGKILATHDLLIDAGDSTSTLAVSNQSGSYLQAGNSLQLHGTAGASNVTLNTQSGNVLGNKIDLTLSSLNNSGVIQGGAGASNITVGGALTNNEGAQLLLATDVAGSGTINADSISNAGTVQSSGAAAVNLTSSLNNTSTGTMLSKGDMSMRIGSGAAGNQGSIDNQGHIESKALLDIAGKAGGKAPIISIGINGVLRGGSMNMKADSLTVKNDPLVKIGGIVNTTGDMTLDLNTLSFDGAYSKIVAATNGGIANITLADGFTNPGIIHSGGDLIFKLPSLKNDSNGGISALGNLTINATAGDLFNAGALYAGTLLTASSTGTFTNYNPAANPQGAYSGTMDSSGSMVLSANTFINNSHINAAQDINITTSVFRNEVTGGDTRVWGGFVEKTPVYERTVQSVGFVNGGIGDEDRDYYHQDRVKQQYYAGGKPSNRPQIVSSGTLTISGFNSGVNLGGILSANTINLIGNGSTFTNDALDLNEYVERKTWDYFTHWTGVRGVGPTINKQLENETSYSYYDFYRIDSVGASIKANNSLSVQNLGLVNQDSTPRINVNISSAQGAEATQSVNGNNPADGAGSQPFSGLNISLPTNPNGYFVISKDPNSNYLIETNPLFGVGTGLIGSNYLADRLGYDPDTMQRRLGDAAYENYLVRQQLIAQTGKNILQGYQDESRQIKAFLDAAADQSTSLGLVYGKALSADQVAHLNSDIVWMVEVEVAGKKVLAPVVYLSQASRDSIQHGAVIAGKDVHMDLTSMTNTGGTIAATNTMTIVATGDIRNTSGTISADNMALASTNGKIINETTVTRVGDKDNYQDVASETGTIAAKSNLIVSGNQGVDIVGASVSAGTSAVLHSENGNINIQSLALDSKSTTEKHTSGFLYSSSEKTVETNQTRQAASVTVGDGKNPEAQLTLLAEKGNVNLTSADLTSSGSINIKANDINSNVLNLEKTRTYSSTSSGISTAGGALTIGSSSAHSEEKATTASGSNITAGGALNMQAANNIVLEGGSYGAKTVSLDAGNDVITKAAKNTYSSTESSSSAGLTMGNGNIGAGAKSDAANINATGYTNAQITAADGAAIVAKNKVDIGGVNIAVLNKASPPDNTQGGNSGAPDSTSGKTGDKANTVALGFDVAKLRSAVADGSAAQFIDDTAKNGMGTAAAMADMAKPEKGQLTVSGSEIVSTKYKNEYQKTTESSGTYVGIGAKAQSSDSGASAGVGLSIQNNYRKETVGEKSDNINKLAADNVTLDGKKSIDLKGVAIAGDSSINLKSDGNINIAAAEVEKNYSLDSHSTHLNLGLEASANKPAPQTSGISPLPTLSAPVAVSANLNFGHESQTIDARTNTHVDSTLTSKGALNIQSGKGDVTFTGVTASADTLDIKANNFTSAAYKDSSTRTESSTALGVNLTASNDLNKMQSDLFHGNGAKSNTLDRKETAEVGNTIVANTANIDVKNNVTLVGGNLVADDLNIKANTVDIKATKNTLDEHKTEVGASLTMDGSAAFVGNKAWASIDSMQGKLDTGTSQGNGLADRTGDGRVNSGKAVSDELLSAKTGLTITAKEETTKSETYSNAGLQFKNLTIDTTAAPGSAKGDGHVDIGGANLLATTDASSINITTGELKTTKYVDKTERTSHDNSTFIGVASEGHSAVADTVNHSKTLADKAKEGMTIDPTWAAAQAAGDASNMLMGDAAGGSIAATVRNSDTTTHSISTSENINYINAGNINIKTTKGDIALNGVEFNAPPTVNKDTGALEKAGGPRPKNISLDSAGDITMKAAKSTYTETSTTLTNDVNLTASGSISATGSGVGVDAGYNGSIEQNSLSKTTYTNASLNADNVSIKGKNLSMTGANVGGGNVKVDIENNIDIKSVQDTQTQKTTRANWGGSAGLNTTTIVSANGQGGGGDSHDNFAITAKQSGITAENSLNLSAGGNLTLTGAQIASAGGGNVNIKGNVTANKLDDFHEKDGLFAGGSGGISQGGINAGINLEKVDQIHNATTQNSTISGVGMQVGGKIQGDNLQADGSLQTQSTTVLKDEKIAGVYVNGTRSPGLGKKVNSAVKTVKSAFKSNDDSAPNQSPVKAPVHDAVSVKNNTDTPSPKLSETSTKAPEHHRVRQEVDGEPNPTVPRTTDRDASVASKSDEPAKQNFDSVLVLIPADQKGGGDKVVQDAAGALVNKNEREGRNVVLAQEKANGGVEVLKGELSQLKGNTKTEFVEHGGEHRTTERAAELANTLNQTFEKAPDATHLRTNLNTCTTAACDINGGKSFGEKLAGELKVKEVAEYTPGSKSHIDGDGNKHVKSDHGDSSSVVWKIDGGEPRKTVTKLDQGQFDDAVALAPPRGVFESQGIAMRFPGGKDFKTKGEPEVRETSDLIAIYKNDDFMRSKYKGNATPRNISTEGRSKKERVTSGIPISGERNELSRAGWSAAHVELAHELTAKLQAASRKAHNKAENSHALGHGDFGVDHLLSAPPASKHQNTEQLGIEVAMRLAAQDLVAQGLPPDSIRLKVTDAINPDTGALAVRRMKIMRRLDETKSWDDPNNVKIAVDYLMDAERKGISKETVLALSEKVYDALVDKDPLLKVDNYKSTKEEEGRARGLNRVHEPLPAPEVKDLAEHAAATLATLQQNKKNGQEFDRKGVPFPLTGPAYTDLTVKKPNGETETFTNKTTVKPEDAAIGVIAGKKKLSPEETKLFYKTKSLPADESTVLVNNLNKARQELNELVEQLEAAKKGVQGGSEVLRKRARGTEENFLGSIKDKLDQIKKLQNRIETLDLEVDDIAPLSRKALEHYDKYMQEHQPASTAMEVEE